jgi:hypothetical protein
MTRVLPPKTAPILLNTVLLFAVVALSFSPSVILPSRANFTHVVIY